MRPLPFTTIAVLLLAASCTHEPATGESIAEVCRKENDRREVAVSGYLKAPILVGCHEKDCTLQLTPTRRDHYGLSVRLPLGTGPSTMTPLPPPRKDAMPFTAERVSVSIRDAKGASVDVGDVVRVAGSLSASQSGAGLRCEVTVARLERL